VRFIKPHEDYFVLILPVFKGRLSKNEDVFAAENIVWG